MGNQFETLEGRTLMSFSLGGGFDISSLTKLLGGSQSGLSSSFISQFSKNLLATSGKKPSASSLSKFNSDYTKAFSDKKLSSTENLGLNGDLSSVYKSEGLSSALQGSLSGETSAILGSKMSTASKSSFLSSYSSMLGSFGKTKII